ncbi:protein-glutamate O-methyltransferase CheR [Candidatus Bathyarchaeota archaeon]|nr:protein-glutamate O-methyltransferase CheR [Candidatus Bathyarchaeota archaeon]
MKNAQVKQNTGKSGEMISVEDFLEDVAYQKMKKLLHEKVGLDFNGYREEYLKRRFSIRLRATGTNTYRLYVRYLQKNPDEYNRVIDNLVINYTTFFRDKDVYGYLEKIVLPRLFRSNKVRIWSAGCATGEEPYSLSILVHKVLGKKRANYDVKILASDIDENALGKAAKAEYSRKQLNGMRDSLIAEYFSTNGESYQVKDFVKQLVSFESHDLMKPSLRKGFDLILCRNVMIFFSRESQQKIHMHFYNTLREGGYLVIGKAEVLSGQLSQQLLCDNVNCRVYQKSFKDGYNRSPSELSVTNGYTLNLNNSSGGQCLVAH